jgi:predicted MFS family arabinose efflux permease
MGIALWTACSLLVFAAARFVPPGRTAQWIGELAAALVSAMIFGLLATYFDFGGWNELDWRAGLFVFFGAAAVIAISRIVRLMRWANPAPTPHPSLPTPQKQ